MSYFSMLIIIFILLTTGLQIILALRQIHFLQKSTNHAPVSFQSSIKNSDAQKAFAYNLYKLKFSILKNGITNTIILFIISTHFLHYLFLAWHSIQAPNPLRNAGFLLTIIILQYLIALPFSYWQTFVIEQRFGFNTMSLPTFLMDFVKQLVLVSVVALPILILASWLLASNSLWWLWIWVLVVSIAALSTLFSPLLKSWLFYKHAPLNTPKLIEQIKPLLSDHGFTTQQVFIINSSSRTQHSNAHFVGFGWFKRILLSDTLMSNFSNEEITAIVAHELGHYFRQHILHYSIIIAALGLIGFMALGWIMGSFDLLEATQILFIGQFLLIFPLIQFWFNPLLCLLTRHFEHDADQFAGLNGHNKALQLALIKLYGENASILKSDPWFSFWYDTHPSPQQRIAAIQNRATTIRERNF